MLKQRFCILLTAWVLTRSKQRCRTEYAFNDCLTVTLLHKPMSEGWSLDKLRAASLDTLFTSNSLPRSTTSLSSTLFTFDVRGCVAPVQPLMELQEDSEEDSEEEEIFLSSLTNHQRIVELVNPCQEEEEIGSVSLKCEAVDSGQVNPSLSVNDAGKNHVQHNPLSLSEKQQKQKIMSFRKGQRREEIKKEINNYGHTWIGMWCTRRFITNSLSDK